jgi:hypothetical protein
MEGADSIYCTYMRLTLATLSCALMLVIYKTGGALPERR